ncbi:mortality factor 4-like protein 1 [Uloborus diversus]|uniref:mortality factor 4-like protein 1 n=1 Tax=Uloborus diversus TaxID=327109 RepID=UPI0024092393|nr:mortality factor 4-like protein 1 [Uloborus diversus]
MAPKARFVDGEKVLCFHGPLLYEAKCLKSMLKDKHVKYFIHYSGWNKNWDEWVPECRVLKCNEANLLKQKELAKTHMKGKKSKGCKLAFRKELEKELPRPVMPEKTGNKPKIEKKSLTPTPTATSSDHSTENEPEPPVKKKRSRPEPCFLEDLDSNTEVSITMPPELRNRLVDDCDLVTRQKKLILLPARITVDHVIASYVKDRVSGKGVSQAKELIIVQMANKVRDCFNVFLGKMLLYKFERPQYAEMLAEYHNSSMCQVYSAIHFLRMFTQFGNLLSPHVKGDPEIPELIEHLQDFVKYMDSNQNFFSLDDYVVASPEYHRRAL